jgi:Ca2+-binding RTX toxin-like protein
MLSFFEPKDGTVIDLSLLSKDVLGDLNAVLVNSQTSVNITVPTDFNGTVISGGGDDLIVFKPRQTTGTTDSGSGNDTVKTSTGSDSVNSGGGNDSVASGQGTDSVNGGQGDDSIKTGSGSDTVTSGTGHDTVRTGAGSDSVNMGSGDSVKMGGGRDTATYTDDNTQVTKAFVDGGAGRDTLRLEGVSIEKVEQSNNKLNITLSDKSLLVVSNVELFGYDFNNDGSIGNDEIIDLVGFVGHNFGS